MELKFPKLYRYDRAREHCSIAVPFAKGQLWEGEQVQIFQDGNPVPTQQKVTSRYEDGSVRYLFVRFMADLPGNRGAVLELKTKHKEGDGLPQAAQLSALQVFSDGQGYQIQGGLSFAVADDSNTLFEWLKDGNQHYNAGQLSGPYLQDGEGRSWGIHLGKWQLAEQGPLVAVLRCRGIFETDSFAAKDLKALSDGGQKNEAPSFEIKLTAYAEKPWVEISFRLINSTGSRLGISSLVFGVLAKEDEAFDPALGRMQQEHTYHTFGTGELSAIEKEIEAADHDVRTCVGSSNYRTDFYIAADGDPVEKVIDADFLIDEANEHFAEVLYGTFFGDRTDQQGGVCATVYQAQQNYPKAVKADRSGVYVMLVPQGVGQVVMEPGMSREQRFLLHFHPADERLAELDNRSLIYQMPDRPVLSPEIFQKAGVMPDIFVDSEKRNDDVEISLIAKCDGHARCYGMLNWGDAPDPGYTTQGRGKGMPVWTNNEYDYPHACALMYARTGERRFLDYMLVAGSHWMDVDVCHYSQDPLLQGGQWEHTRGHCVDGVIVCSHEWVEGLLDYYHFTGDERALETALGIGENVSRLLDTPMYQKSGELNARETGWALRTLTALYGETHDEKWKQKCGRILEQFQEWKDAYGGWLAPYTDNTMIRVGFMISVAVGSIMRYYRLFPQEELKEMMLEAVDDLVENCLMDNGLFYYKELPSLNRLGNNTLLLEALTIAYELTGEVRYLTYGKQTFWKAINAPAPGVSGVKSIVGDAVLHKTGGTKNFAQSFLPLTLYYKAAVENGLL